jgi:hypothetical protein
MSHVNALLRAVIDTIQTPLAGLPVWFGVLVWSIPLGVFALVVFKWTSNQERIADVKRRIAAGLFEIRLFNDDLRAIARAQGEILRHVLVYQALALKPMLFILPPLVLVIVHLHAYYGFRPPAPDEPVVLTAVFEPGVQRPATSLELPAGVVADTPAVWASDLGEMTWRLRVVEPGRHEIRVTVGDATWAKSLTASDRVVRLSPVRPDSSFLGQLEWPSEPPLPATSGLHELAIDYPDARFDMWPFSSEWRYAWMVAFFILTLVVALALKRPLGVEL